MDAFRSRIENFIYDSWKVFGHKVGNEVIHINQEVSMQLQFALLLKNHLEFIIYDKKEKIEVELEYGLQIKDQPRTIDILLKTSNGKETLNIPIELGCYKKISYAENKSGDHDEFIKNIYLELENLEKYASLSRFTQGYALLLTDDKSLVYPRKEDTSDPQLTVAQGHETGEGIQFKPSDKKFKVILQKHYRFEWHQHGDFWFSLVQGI